MQKHETSAMHH